ncbi:MAG TPA: carboxypeptidase-like regulatory domain-containing protein, partial [Terriglobales bacterium]|nr:carboxypeptidase-like regulatory domain-containing protein [Terriglobales bacterium]
MNMLQKWTVSLRGAILALAVVAIACTGHNAFAQSGRASITGVVTDSSGAVVQDVSVTATNTATGVATSAKTNAAGTYSLLQLQPGTYSLRVEKEGFSSQVQENYLLVAEQSGGVNFSLHPGQVSERVNVEANSELIHTESAEISQTITEHAIVELPLNGRNPAELVLL